MTAYLEESVFFGVTLTVLAFSFGQLLQKKWKSPLLNPIVISAILVILTLKLLDIPNEAYQRSCSVLTYFLTPATICFAISFYEQLQKLKKHLPAVLLGVLAGTVCSLGYIYMMCWVMGLDAVLTASLLPKSVTTAIGLALCEEMGGVAAVTTAAIVITGIFGNMAGPFFCKLLKIRHPVAQGVAFGTASHVVGTSKANEIGALCGAASSLSLTVAGLMTAVFLSFLTGI